MPNHIADYARTDNHTPSKSFFFQSKLQINDPNDQYEKEADEMADKVMRMQQPFIQAKALPISTVQRKCAHCEEDEKEAQRKEMNGNETTSDHVLESYVDDLNGSGHSLSKEVRNFYESRFGYDFSHVKVHTDNVAAKSAQSINAVAYTSGNNIVFNSGQYSPNTDSGKRLLGHELTHVVQQERNIIQNKLIQRFCTPSATCAAPISGSAEAFVDEETRRQAAAVARRKRMTPARALSTGHGGHARQLETFLQAQAPGRLANIQGIFLDMDISSNFGAFHQPCGDWISEALPPGAIPDGMAGATRNCVFVPAILNQQALRFNTTTASVIGGKSRDDWRVDTLRILTHETQHAIFSDLPHGTPAGITSASCTRATISAELTELSAILSEFPILFRAIPAGAAASHSSRIRLSDWFQFNVIDSPQSIKGILTTIGCSCNCPEVDAFVIDTFNFTTSSWTPAERAALNVELRKPVWGLRWPL